MRCNCHSAKSTYSELWSTAKHRASRGPRIEVVYAGVRSSCAPSCVSVFVTDWAACTRWWSSWLKRTGRPEWRAMISLTNERYRSSLMKAVGVYSMRRREPRAVAAGISGIRDRAPPVSGKIIISLSNWPSAFAATTAVTWVDSYLSPSTLRSSVSVSIIVLCPLSTKRTANSSKVITSSGGNRWVRWRVTVRSMCDWMERIN